MMYAVLNRLRDNTHTQTLGRWYFYDGLDEVFKCVTLELADRDNQNNISRIPKGKYKIVKRWSKKFQWHFHVTEVPGRSWILVHSGNYYTQIEGCILVGVDFKDINSDNELDVRWSRYTLDKMLEIAPKEFDLYINEMDDLT